MYAGTKDSQSALMGRLMCVLPVTRASSNLSRGVNHKFVDYSMAYK